MHLRARADVPELDAQELRSIAEAANRGCPVSNALAGNVEITVDATLL